MSDSTNFDMRNTGMKATALQVPLYGWSDAIMKVSAYIPNDTIIATYNKNIIVVENNTNKKYDKVVIKQDPYRDEKFYVLTDFHMGVNYKFGNHIVYAQV